MKKLLIKLITKALNSEVPLWIKFTLFIMLTMIMVGAYGADLIMSLVAVLMEY